MRQARILGPFFVTMILTLVVWVYMYTRRISFIMRHGVSSQDLAAPDASAVIRRIT